MNGEQQPTVTIEHELPGRLRLRLSHALRQPERVRRLVAEHAGVDGGAVHGCQPLRAGALRSEAHLDAKRSSFASPPGCRWSSDNAGIRVLTRPPTRELTDSAFYSGIVLLAALALRVLGQYTTAERRSGADCRPHHGGGRSVPRLGGLSAARELRSGSAHRDLSADCTATRQCIAGGDLHVDQHLRPSSGSTCRPGASSFVPRRPAATAPRRASRLWSPPTRHRRIR